MKLFGVFFLSIVVLTGCSNNPVVPSATQVVLQAYLYADQPVQDIYLGSSRAIGGSDSIDTPIANASISLVRNGVRYSLTPNPLVPGAYLYPGKDLTVRIGDQFSIEVDYGGQVITAATVVPTKPEQLSLSTSTLRFQQDSIQTRIGARARINGLDSAVVAWSNPNSEYYYVVLESVDQNRQLLRPDSNFTGRFVSEPTNQSFYRINNNSILYTGNHVLKLYHVDKEYADLYGSRLQDSRALNEPLTNVTNGLGIFSAFASDSLSFSVVLQ